MNASFFRQRLPQAFFLLFSLLIVAFGQPLWSWPIGMAAGTVGFALFWKTLLDIPSAKARFWLATAWFAGVQLIQLYWMVYHPYSYIYIVYLFLAFAVGAQFGVIAIFITPRLFQKWLPLAGVAGLWTLMEWSRLHFFSGYSWNPVGLALAGNVYALQAVSLLGVFGLSFWVFFVNLAALRCWLEPKLGSLIILIIAAMAPISYGYYHRAKHEPLLVEAPKMQTLLIQTAFPAEEALEFKDFKHYVAFVIDEWTQILKISEKQAGKKIDLVALPEYVVPFGTYSFIYPYDVVSSIFKTVFGASSAAKLPKKEWPFAQEINVSGNGVWFVNNAFWAQSLSNILEAPLIAGLEDAEDIDGTRERYSAALFFAPQSEGNSLQSSRYSKRVLVPMAEYIPFSFCRQLAAQYGINGSFTCGQEAQVYQAGAVPFSTSICYEETFGELTREGRLKGAQLFVNLTSDVWFPNSLLPYQHLEHSRLRTVENGVPLVRSCNTGITSSIDSLGNTVAMLGETREQHEWTSGSLLTGVSTYSYDTLYTQYGDSIILLLSLGFFLLYAGFLLLKIDPLF